MSRVTSASGTYKSTTVPQYQLSALAALACTLDARKFALSDRQRRASVCMILRVHSKSQEQNTQNNTVKHNTTAAQRTRNYSTTEEFENSEPASSTTRSSRKLVNVLTSINRLGTTDGFHQADSELQLLYMLRQHNPRDRWSGQISFPGGRKANAQESDEQTCIREVYEEIGVDLTNNKNYVQLGRLDDFHIDPLAKGLKQLAVSVFVYLQLNNSVPLKLDSKEVRAVIWTNVSYFTESSLPWSSLKFPVKRVTESDKQRAKTPGQTHMQIDNRPPNTSSIVKSNHTAATNDNTTSTAPPIQYGLSAFVSAHSDNFKALLPVSFFPFSIHFPALTLPGTFITCDGKVGESTGNVHAVAKESDSHVHITAAGAQNNNNTELREPDHTANEFVLWGFTLRLTAQLMLIMGSPRMQRFLELSDRSSRILQWIVSTNDSIQSVSAFTNLGSWKRRDINKTGTISKLQKPKSKL